MEPNGATDLLVRNRNYNIKPASLVIHTQTVDEEIAFPAFAFPVNDGAAALDAWKAVTTAGQGQSVQVSNGIDTWGFLQEGEGIGDESPKIMPSAFHKKNVDLVPESRPSFPSQVAEPSTKQYLSSLATFKDLDLTHENGRVEIIEKSGSDVPLSPTRKNLIANSKVEVKDSTVAPSTPKGKGSSITFKVTSLQKIAAKSPDKVKPDNSSLTGTTSSGGRPSLINSRRGEERGRARSPAPDQRSLTSPRRAVPERSRSPVPFRKQDRGTTGVSRSLSPVPTSPRSTTPTRRPSTPRSISPAPRSLENSRPSRNQFNGSSVNSASMPSSPRYTTPTRAASLKAVNSPPSVKRSVSKELQYPIASGNATSQRDPLKKDAKDQHTKSLEENQHIPKVRTSSGLTQPTGFKFSTDERSEKRRDYYSKLEEKLKLKEEERKSLEAKAQEDNEAQLRELRKTLAYKANPVPKFYQESLPPPVKVKKSPTTRAKSPNFTAPRRRDSTGSELSNHGGSSPLRGRFMRSPSVESDLSNPANVLGKGSVRVKQPFKPI
ncbi:uncharacterized protein [Physcomitrium patens]|uniref:TPX2 C-terminal domain-containing protein n=1 Tax=Physcomitrium patens TaxID=3218 RepID=A0A2K1INT6_PHYPA|nr:serine/arginine repetitive matrix protein 2-like [Physcomitrium patens]XP_024360564.1 serine/arginine repetitive matrix protein 2-like [Physcomitrium patens]XP_024360565.1 serine/arginine repetitive matrix protein 2-like [Physcomitrium patens]XP_024360566.1 serine/arginine repetitive matrix protein 2-like [Physcomitrium patens]XP_024360567.1 serine/arginine repetitive matrix protein 2-like [Physcomitrium patens]XP_024360568.1 serine/arginine repetitive matrix protein 2-like [Physcomitrium p|eukprot:XP_024360563.1 serine/arginine repetitive matrix protein 2-like [Physcomitrella patens]